MRQADCPQISLAGVTATPPPRGNGNKTQQRLSDVFFGEPVGKATQVTLEEQAKNPGQHELSFDERPQVSF